MDISGDDAAVADGHYPHIAKRLKIRATIGRQGGGLLTIAPAKKPLIDTEPSTTGDAGASTPVLGHSTQSSVQDANYKTKDVSPKGNKAGVLFSHMFGAPKQAEPQYLTSRMEIRPNSNHDEAVETVVRLVGTFSLADINGIPTVVALSSKAIAAARLISVVERAKAQIAADNQKWYQYNEVQGVTLPKKSTFAKRIGGGKTLQDWEDEQLAIMMAKETTTAAKASKDAGEDAMDVDEDVFQTMVRRKSEDLQAVPHFEDPWVQAPSLNIFLARVRIPSLLQLFG